MLGILYVRDIIQEPFIFIVNACNVIWVRWNFPFYSIGKLMSPHLLFFGSWLLGHVINFALDFTIPSFFFFFKNKST